MQTKETHSLTAMGRAAALRIEPVVQSVRRTPSTCPGSVTSPLGCSQPISSSSPTPPASCRLLGSSVFLDFFFFWCRLPGETGFMESMAFTSFCLFPIKTGIRESGLTESLCWRCPAEGPVSPNARHVKEEASGLLLLQPLPGQSLKGLG